MDTNIQYPKDEITGAILAGGKGSRMKNQDKGLVELAGSPMIEHVIKRIKPQVGTIVINANRHLEEYQRYGCPVVADPGDDFQGPLAGMATCLHHSETRWMVTTPCDSPLLPGDLVAKLYHALQLRDADIAVATDGQRIHPVFCLLSSRLAGNLEEFIESGGRKIDTWFQRVDTVQVDFGNVDECFWNINTPAELSRLERYLLKQ